MAKMMQGIVKSVLSSGDTVVIRAKAGPFRERTLHLAGVSAPRMGTRDRADEPYAFESRDFLRLLLVGREVNFTVAYNTPTAGEFGSIFLPSRDNLDVAFEVLREGWGKFREGGGKGGDGGEEDERKIKMKQLEEEAKAEGKGIWKGQEPQRTVKYSMPEDPQKFLNENKDKPIDALIEAVQNGSTFRVRLLLSPTEHQIVNLALAGVRSPRARTAPPNAAATNTSTQDDGEECGDEAKFFVETRLLQRSVQVKLLSLPTPAATPASLASASTSSPAPAGPPSTIIGNVLHPAGKIEVLILQQGLGKIIDWHAGIISASSPEGPKAMEPLRKAQQDARDNRRGVWKDAAPKAGTANGAAGVGSSKAYQAVVSRIWAGDSIGVRKVLPGSGEDSVERRIQFSSVRQPRPTDPKQAGFQSEAKEALRKRLIGKSVNVAIDYIKPKEGDYEERECATVRLPNGTNVAEMLVERGLAAVIRHRRDDEDRSQAYDRLMAAEQKAASEQKGIHSGKDAPAPRPPGDASENSAKANQFLSGLKRAGRIPVVVDFVASGSRFKIFCPKQDVKLTLVLTGIRAPRTARDAREKSEAFGREAYDFMARRAFQRDAEMTVEATDRSGGFIGSLYLNKTENAAVLLLKEGLATINEKDRSSLSKDYAEAEREAKQAKKNLWHDYDEEAEQAAQQVSTGPAEPPEARQEYLDILISDIREDPFSFAFQKLKNGGVPELENMMEEIRNHYASAPPAPGFAPRSGDLIAARFSADDSWYRARVRRNNPARKIVDLIYVDYGNSEEVGYDRIRPLEPQFKSLEPQAFEGALSFVDLLPPKSDFYTESIDQFRALVENRSLVANVDWIQKVSPTQKLHHLSLYDPQLAHTPEKSLNRDMVEEGLATINLKLRYRESYPFITEALSKASYEAKRTRSGAYQYGDSLPDEDDFD